MVNSEEVLVQDQGALAKLAEKKIAVINAKTVITADFKGNGEPSFEWTNDVVYRDANILALLMLQSNIASLVAKVVEDGRQLNIDAASR